MADMANEYTVDMAVSQPRALPAEPSGRGLFALWLVLGLVVVIGLALGISFGLGVMLLRS